jgi:hyperosmotically inducible protein
LLHHCLLSWGRKMKQIIYLLISGLLSAKAIGCALPPKKTSQDVILDSSITTKVRTRLASSATLNLFPIDIESRQGIVTLTGNVPTEERKRWAGELAASVVGVKAIENLLQVGPKKRGEIFEDAVITSRITSRLIQNPLTHTLTIDVETLSGRVVLSGRVKSEDEKREAERMARRTEGVVSVENQLKVAVD